MAGEAKRHAVEPHHAQAEGECRCVRRKPRGELRFQRDHPQSSLISTNDTFGISPARNAASDNCSRSSAKRTGTSKRNPALTSCPSGGAAVKLIQPPGSSDQPINCSTPSIDTRTLPESGRVMRSEEHTSELQSLMRIS